MILDAITEVFAWFGARSTKPERLIAMHTIQVRRNHLCGVRPSAGPERCLRITQKLVADSPRGHRKAAGQWVTFPFEEPIAFTRHFHVWSTTQFSAEQVRDAQAPNGMVAASGSDGGPRGRTDNQRAKLKTFLPVDTVLAQYERRVFSYEALVAKEVPDTVDKTKLEVGACAHVGTQ